MYLVNNFLTTMKEMYFFNFLFIFSILLGVCSSSFIGIWFSMEFGLMIFIPILIGEKSFQEIECCMKYFLIQSFSSVLYLYSCIISFNYYCYYEDFNFIFWILLISILIKLGAAPLHFWFPSICSGISWKNFFLISVLQKIIPLYLLLSMSVSNLTMIFMSFMSLMFGSLGSLNQLNLKKLLAYSSISHLAWLMMSMKMSWLTFMCYFLFYSLIMSEVTFFLKFMNIEWLMEMNLKGVSSPLFLIMAFKFFSLAGLPPFLGFYPKSSVIYMMMKNNLIWYSIIMMIMGLFSVFVYTRMILSFLLMSFNSLKVLKMEFWIMNFNLLVFLFSEIFIIMMMFMFFGIWIFF
uniref:NADH dehydrogenase subunit 2 n=1 Tax=Aeolothrips xinjiangensis TaxID=2942826 RepID=UPI0020299074|nr:NADH dehydrogenase subunit 2 [Aeolothrips xinjiangensis]UQJ77472.1 NADH dehydrogenase subunit 2 [Aeolothrips xinjiangensis]